MNFQMFKLFEKRQRNQILNCQHHWIIKKARVPEKHVLPLYWLCQRLCGSKTNCGKFLKRIGEFKMEIGNSRLPYLELPGIPRGIPDYLTCLLRNLYGGQEATVRTGHGATDWFQIGKGVRQGCILSPCLFNLQAEYITVKCWTGWSTSWNQNFQEKYQ